MRVNTYFPTYPQSGYNETPQESAPMKTLDVMDKYLSQKRLAPESRNAIRNMFKHLNTFTTTFPRNAGTVNEFLRYLETDCKFNDVSLRQYHILLKMVFKYMHDAYEMPNPMSKVPPIKVLHKERRIFTDLEVFAIIQTCKNEWETLLIKTLIDSSCRIGELANLQVNDIGDNSIRVVGKTGQGTHRLAPHLCEALKALPNYNGYVFRTPQMQSAFPAHILASRVRRIIITAGIKGKKLGAHTLRHTSATTLARGTNSAIIVKSHLQHTNLKTSEIYMHLADNDIQQQNSPLQMIGESLVNKQALSLQQGNLVTKGFNQSDMSVVETSTNKIDELLESSFEQVPENVSVRPLFKSDDLSFIRRALICIAQFGEKTTDSTQARDLYKRITRKI